MSDKALAALKIIVVEDLLRSNPRAMMLLSARTLTEYQQAIKDFTEGNITNSVNIGNITYTETNI